MLLVRTPRGIRSLELEEFEELVRSGGVRGTTLVRMPVVTGDRWVSARELEIFRRLYSPGRVHFHRTFSLNQIPLLTLGLCVLLVLTFVWMGDGPTQGLDTLIAWGAKVRPLVLEQGQTWRLLSANLLHRDWLHLLLNVFFLFNIGGPLENAFKGMDFLLILTASALGTTTLSLLLSSTPSVGASGLVLGLFGSASVFGYRYNEILPQRYRRYFGAGVFPYALFVIYAGLTNPDTDNWGHVGGLLGGALVTLWLTPALLVKNEAAQWRKQGPHFFVAALIGCLLGAGWFVSLVWPWKVMGAEGISIQHPSGWRRVSNYLGQQALGNELGLSLGLRTYDRSDRPFSIDTLQSDFLEEIDALESAGEIAILRRYAEQSFLLEHARAVALNLEVDTRVGRQETVQVFIERGAYAYLVVWSCPLTWARLYRQDRDRLLRSIRLEDTVGLQRASALVEVFPGMSTAHVRLGEELALLGRPQEAAREFETALGLHPDLPDAVFGLAQLHLHYGGDGVSAESALAELWEQKTELRYGLLLSDLRQKLGWRRRACEPLLAASFRGKPKVQSRYRALGCSLLR